MRRALFLFCGSLVLLAWNSGETSYQLELKITGAQHAPTLGSFFRVGAVVRQPSGRWEATSPEMILGARSFSVALSAPPVTWDGFPAATLTVRDTRSANVTCRVDAHEGMIVLPDAGCGCRDVDFLLAFRCPGRDGQPGTGDDEAFVVEGTVFEAKGGGPCVNKPDLWFPDTLAVGYRTCEIPALPDAPDPKPTSSAPAPAPTVDDGGCGGSAEPTWDGGDEGGCDGYAGGDDWGDEEGGCGGTEDDGDWGADEGGCGGGGDDDWGGTDEGCESTDDGTGCEGDSSSDSSCEGDAYASASAPRRRAHGATPTVGVNLPTILFVLLGGLALRRRRWRRARR